MKKGFTLVEIMVVVIIMGVLAAVGVPKLFGLIAKARASEVPVAAGTYISLQNAYLGENNGIGSWKNIGYGAPGNGRTDYFEYSGCINGTIPFASMEPDMPGWQATNRSGLNSCKAGGAWAIVIDPAGEREIDYRQIISSPECAALTTSWGEVGETVEGMCETTGELHVAGTENKTPEKPETPTETPTENPSDPEPSSSPSSSNSTAQSSNQQGDCDALASSIKNDNGNKYGWVCVSACGMFAPPGKARNAGFDVPKSQKKKQTGGTCEKVEPESGTGSSGTNQGSGEPTPSGEGSEALQGSDGTQGSQSTGGGSTGGSTGGGSNGSNEKENPVEENQEAANLSGYKGNGDPHEFNAENDVCLKYNETDASKCEEWDDKAGYEGYAGHGTPHKFDENIDICLDNGYNGNKTCSNWRPISECNNYNSNSHKCKDKDW
jgi:prepilin-type N-terminal cleavage/methylation domain-containing protein